MKFRSTKRIEGFSSCFRQWRADDTHCKFLHGYSIYFDLVFEGDVDSRQWVFDFGFTKRSKTKIPYIVGWNDVNPIVVYMSVGEYFSYMFDHTVIISSSDPEIEWFKKADSLGIIKLRVISHVGCEMFAKFIFEMMAEFLRKETDDRVKIVSVECFEHSKNSATYTI